MTPPVLFLIFNRPDLVEQSFARIRDARPTQLFIAADGPRHERENEMELCNQCREIIEQVDWDCEVKTLFRDKNLGCRVAVSEAITWFFEHVEEGIILEDDCVADPSFFPFCAELIEKYRHDERVMCITGNNFQNGIQRGAASYYFSIYNHCWGWASWRRAWSKFDADLSTWSVLKQNSFPGGFHQTFVADYWRNIFDQVQAKGIDSWAYVWTYSCWAQSGVTATPSTNLVSNIGFDDRATHTQDPCSRQNRVAAEPISFPMIHPELVSRNVRADRFVESNVFAVQPPISVFGRITRRIGTVSRAAKNFLMMQHPKKKTLEF
jgi:hypothetical protein